MVAEIVGKLPSMGHLENAYSYHCMECVYECQQNNATMFYVPHLSLVSFLS